MSRLSTSTWRAANISFLLIATITLIGTALRLYRLDFKGFWGDEIWTAVRSSYTLNTIFTEYIDLPGPFYYVLVHFSLSLFGKEYAELAARLPSTIAGIITVPLVYILVSRLIGRTEGIISALFVAVSPYLIWHSQEARFYSWTTLLSILSTYYLFRALDEKKSIFWFLFIISSTLNLYNQPLSAGVILIAQGFYALFYIVSSQEKAKYFISSFVGFGGVCLFYSPVIYKIFISGRVGGYDRGYVDLSAGESIFSPTLDSLMPYFLHISNISIQGFTIAGPLRWIFFAFFIVGIYSLIHKKDFKNLLLFFSPFIITFFIFVIGRPANGYNIRYVLFLIPLYLIFITLGITFTTTLINQIGKYFKLATFNQNLQAIPIILTFILISLFFPTIRDGYSQAKINDWKSMAAYIETHLQPEDIIIGNHWFRGALTWYLPDVEEQAFVSDLSPYALGYVKDGYRTWYVLIDHEISSEGKQIQSLLKPIEDSHWQSSSLSYVDEASYFPVSEPQARLLFGGGFADPSTINFHDIPQPNWTDRSYKHLAPGEEFVFNLELSSDIPRELHVTFYDAPNKQIEIWIEDILLGVVGNGESGWKTTQLTVPPTLGDMIPIHIKAVGSSASGINSSSLVYIPEQKSFDDIPQPNWTDRSYKHLAPGEEFTVNLAKNTNSNRVLYITYTDYPNKDVEVRIGDHIIRKLYGTGNGWRTEQLAIPRDSDVVIPITIEAIGTEAVGISDIEVQSSSN